MAESLPYSGKDEQAHIWLRYTTQYTQQGRTHTFEIGIPVPLGASAEVRQHLIEEAEAGMEQLSTHVENRIARLLQRNQRSTAPAVVPPAIPPGTPTTTRQAAQPAQAPRVIPSAPTVPAQSQGQSKPVPPQPASAGTGAASGPNPQNEIAQRGQFIQRVRDTLGLTPPQIMERLKVKSLSGFDFEEAYERLKQMGSPEQEQGQGQGAETTTSAPPARPTPVKPKARDQNQPATSNQTNQAPTPPPTPRPHTAPQQATVAEQRPPLRFDEEDDLPDLEEIDFELEEDEEDEPLEPFMGELAGEGKERARGRIERLRATNTTGKAGSDRTRVLKNITDGQISSEQLRQLLRDIWGPAALKTPKSEQVEALISWAKEDHFAEEVEGVLALIEEEGLHASSDR